MQQSHESPTKAGGMNFSSCMMYYETRKEDKRNHKKYRAEKDKNRKWGLKG